VSKKKPPREKKAARVKRPAPIELEARTTIVQAADLHRTLSARVAQGEGVVVDGTRVEEIDTAILQLLASLWCTCLTRGIACTWHGASDALCRTASLVGLAGVLQLLPDGGPVGDRSHAAV
jgi:anti-anti-sigma regulatory factor